jgi:hypothetical protein
MVLIPPLMEGDSNPPAELFQVPPAANERRSISVWRDVRKCWKIAGVAFFDE